MILQLLKPVGWNSYSNLQTLADSFRLRHCIVAGLQGFKSKIEDVREEILRKRRAGKLPGDTTSVLKTWWQQHSKWPYPTVRHWVPIVA